MTDHRIGLDLFNDVLDVLHRHGFARGDDQHAGRAIFLIGDLARIYEGSQDHPYGPSTTQAPYLPEQPVPPGPDPEPGPSVPKADQDAIILTHTDVSTVFAAADIAADDKRYRVEMCTECPDQSCPACQTHLRDAEAFDQIADRMLQAARTAPTAHHGRTGPPRQSRLAGDKEAGQ
jgi:hypothetical protein